MTEQEKREKVIKGLDHELRNRGKCGHYCREGIETFLCEYDKDGLCIQHWGKDALALLKAQGPRVMTLEEVLATEVVYAEDVDKAKIIPVLVDRRAHDRIVLVRARLMGSPSLTIYPLISEYGKRWRCWTSRPTDEQRKETPWLLGKNSAE